MIAVAREATQPANPTGRGLPFQEALGRAEQLHQLDAPLVVVF